MMATLLMLLLLPSGIVSSADDVEVQKPQSPQPQVLNLLGANFRFPPLRGGLYRGASDTVPPVLPSLPAFGACHLNVLGSFGWFAPLRGGDYRGPGDSIPPTMNLTYGERPPSAPHRTVANSGG